MLIGEKTTRPLYRAGTFPSEKWKKKDRRYMLTTIENIASCYKAKDNVEQYLNQHWLERSVQGNAYFPVRFDSIDDARKKIGEFKFPDELKQESERLSRKLMWLLTEDQAPRHLRRQMEGRFDPRASGKLLNQIKAGRPDPFGDVKPFIKHQRVAPKRPHVGIVAAGNWSAMWSDEQYIPRVGALTSAIQWACDALQCEVTSVLARDVQTDYDGYEALSLVALSDGKSPPLQAYAAVFHREMYRVMAQLVDVHNTASIKMLKKCEQHSAEDYVNGEGGSTYKYNERAYEPSDGVQWLESEGCTITVAIGDVGDRKRADVQLGSSVNIEEAVDKIAEQLSKQGVVNTKNKQPKVQTT